MRKQGDVEIGNSGALYPNMNESPQLRWAFIRKVYSIVTFQILLTVAVAGVVVFVRPIPEFLQSRTPAAWAVIVLISLSPLISKNQILERFRGFFFFFLLGFFGVNFLIVCCAALIPMMFLKDKHPWNMILLGLFTICVSFAIGLACSTKSGKKFLFFLFFL